MGILLVELIGFVLIAYAIKMLLKCISINPVAAFNFEDGLHKFDIVQPGYYSIAILGAGFVREIQSVTLKLTSDDGHPLAIRTNKIAPRFTIEARKGIEYWGFSAIGIGRYVLMLSNLEHMEAKSSMLRSKRLLESPIDHSILKIVIYPSVQPFQKLSSIISLVIGVGLVVYGAL